MKILLAEDTKDLNRALCAILKHEGYDVDAAFDGEDVMDFIERDSYDCLVLDIMMPKKGRNSGFDGNQGKKHYYARFNAHRQVRNRRPRSRT